MKRTLTLRAESLADLTADELRGVAGGEAPSGITCPVRDCLINTNFICMDYTWAC